MNPGLKIKRYLQEHGISQAFLSRKTGISAAKLNLSLNGKRNIPFDEYELICGALCLDTNTFLEPRLPDTLKDNPDWAE